MESVGDEVNYEFTLAIKIKHAANDAERDQDGRVVKALDLSSNGRVVRVGSNPTPGNSYLFNSRINSVTNIQRPCKGHRIHNKVYFQFIVSG